MYPMSFSEFLGANTGIYENIQKYSLDQKLPEIYTNKLERALKYYYIVGGMPEVVLKWVGTHNFEEVDQLQENILLD